MSHLTRALTDAACTTAPIDQAQIRAIDDNTEKGINGDGGGTWAPTTKIVLGGAGLAITAPSTFTGVGAGIVTAPGKHVQLGRLDEDDHVSFETVRSRLLTSLLQVPSGNHAETIQDDSNPPYGGVQTRKHGSRWLSALRVHHGGTIATATLIWQVQSPHFFLPEFRPRMRLVRVSASGIVEPLRAVSADTDDDGFVFLGDGTSAAAYDAGNFPQSQIYTANIADRLKVDVGRYVYFAEFIEESGENAFIPGSGNGNRFYVCQLLETNIQHLGPQ